MSNSCLKNKQIGTSRDRSDALFYNRMNNIQRLGVEVCHSKATTLGLFIYLDLFKNVYRLAKPDP
jgi:hypothetical protein